MDEIKFSWDEHKAGQNVKKHKVSFQEALTVFYDENAIEYFDPEHSKSEDRFLILGLSGHFRIIVVSYCVQQKDSQIRIISARKATKKEGEIYIEGRK